MEFVFARFYLRNGTPETGQHVKTPVVSNDSIFFQNPGNFMEARPRQDVYDFGIFIQAGWGQEMNINRCRQGNHQSNESNKQVWSPFL